MNHLEARDALVATVNDIAAKLNSLGITVRSDCYFADRDLFVVAPESSADAAVIAAELELTYDGCDEKIILECAVACDDGEVLADDLTNECSGLRSSVKEIVDTLSSADDKKEAFIALCHPDEEPHIDRPEPQSNKYYYLAAAFGVIAIVLFVLLIDKLFG